jgi:prevent-host-death family protein
MTIVNVHAAKTNLSKLLDRALKGEEVVIARAGKPLLRLTPVPQPALGPRVPGTLAHLVPPGADLTVPELTEEELAEWYDAPLVADPEPGSEPA